MHQQGKASRTHPASALKAPCSFHCLLHLHAAYHPGDSFLAELAAASSMMIESVTAAAPVLTPEDRTIFLISTVVNSHAVTSQYKLL